MTASGISELEIGASQSSSVTELPPVVASAWIRSSAPRDRMSSPHSAPACSMAVRSSASMRFSRTISGQRLRDLEDRCELQVFDRRADRAARVGRRLFLAEVRIELVELPHFAVGSPAQVALAGVSQVKLCDLLEAARRVETRRNLVRHGLIVDKAVCSGRADGLFVEAHRVNI